MIFEEALKSRCITFDYNCIYKSITFSDKIKGMVLYEQL